MKKLLVVMGCLLSATSLFGLVDLKDHGDQLSLSTVYGTIRIDEPVLIELIKSPAFQRLQSIRQYGVMCHARHEPEFTRYQHSLGVFAIAKKYGALLEEQIDALLHDASHTIFSHVGDRFFKSNYLIGGKASYQDTIHEWYLEKSGVTDILKKYGLVQACSNDAKQRHCCFDQALPDLGADRIEYNLTGGLIDGLISAEEINTLLVHLHFSEQKWFFDDAYWAKRLGLISLILSESRWGAAWSGFIDHAIAQALQRAYELGMITLDEIHFSTDDLVWQKLATSSDDYIVQRIYQIEHCQEGWSFGTAQDHDLHLRTKFSGTDPLVKIENSLLRLTLVDRDYQAEFERVKSMVSKGWYLKIKP